MGTLMDNQEDAPAKNHRCSPDPLGEKKEHNMEDNNEIELSHAQKGFLKIISFSVAFFYWLNLFGFLDLFFGIVFPNLGRSDFGHYLEFAIILAIMASVGENLRKKRVSLFLGFTLLLFVVNVYSIWRNWFYR
jgi:hypothetical protein